MFLEQLNQHQQETLMCLAHNVAVSDGDFQTGEQVLMATMRREMALAPDFEPEYIPLAGIERVFDTRRSRIIALIALIRLGYADGAFEIEEQCLLSDIAAALDINEPGLRRTENWVRRLLALEQEALDLL